MEEAILKIIEHPIFPKDKASDPNYTPNMASAKEIAGTFERFMEWLIKDKEVFYGTLSEGYLLANGDDIQFNTLSDLFSYWLEHINK